MKLICYHLKFSVDTISYLRISLNFLTGLFYENHFCSVGNYIRVSLLIFTIFLQLSNLSDKEEKAVPVTMTTESKHKCRIIGFDAMDGVVIVATKKSILEQPFLRYEDIKPGSLVEVRDGVKCVVINTKLLLTINVSLHVYLALMIGYWLSFDTAFIL